MKLLKCDQIEKRSASLGHVGMTELLYTLLVLLVSVACQSVPEPSGLVGKPDPEQSLEPVTKNVGALWYGIEVDDNKFSVSVRMFAPDRTTRFFLPAAWGGSNHFGDLIEIHGAWGPEGPKFLTIDRDAGHLEVDAGESEWIEVRYSVRTKDKRLHSPKWIDGNLLVYSPTFLILPSQQILERTETIPIELHTPAHWDVFASWASPRKTDKKNRTVVGFVAPSADDLRDSFFVAGPHLNRITNAKKTTHFAVPDSFSGDAESVFEVVDSAVAHYRNEFGEIGPVHVLAVPSKKTSPLQGMGRKNGFVFDLRESGEMNKETKLLIAHEAFHLWNGHLAIPEPKSEPATRWFKEGVTHYVAIVTAHKLGLFNDRDVLDEFAEIADSYRVNPLSRNLRGTELDRRRFPYDRGVLAALMVDTYLSERGLSINNWIDQIIDDGRMGKTFTNASLHRALLNLAPNFPTHFIAGKKRINLRVLFANVGLHWLPASRSRRAKLIGLDDTKPIYKRLWAKDRSSTTSKTTIQTTSTTR